MQSGAVKFSDLDKQLNEKSISLSPPAVSGAHLYNYIVLYQENKG